MWDEQNDRVADDGENVEEDEGAAKSPAVDNQPAGICVDRPEQGTDRIKSPDDKNRRAERLEVLREEAHPQFLSCANGKDGDKEDYEIAAQPEKFRERAPVFHQPIGRVVAAGRSSHS